MEIYLISGVLRHPIIFALFQKSITILPIKRAENRQNAGKLGVIVVFLHGKKINLP